MDPVMGLESRSGAVWHELAWPGIQGDHRQKIAATSVCQGVAPPDNMVRGDIQLELQWKLVLDLWVLDIRSLLQNRVGLPVSAIKSVSHQAFVTNLSGYWIFTLT